VLSGFEGNVELPDDVEPAFAEVRRRLEQTRRNFQRLRLRGSEPEILANGLRAVYRQGRHRMQNAIDLGEDSAFHRWRIRAKNLYYELEFLESVWPKRFHGLISRLSELQEKIGRDHDAAVLRARLKRSPENFGGSETVQRVINYLDSQTRKLRQSAVPLGRKIWRQKPRRFVYKVAQHWRKR
jgi:CHAD domain-containing protein